MGIGLEATGGGNIRNIAFNNCTSVSSDVLIFSATMKYSREAHEDWKRAEGYDSCYQITSARLFLRALSVALGKAFVLIGAGPVVYEDSLSLSDRRAATHPAFVKRGATFADQLEYRAVWRTLDESQPRPMVIERSNAHLYARHFTII